jgi:hypothetical protein
MNLKQHKNVMLLKSLIYSVQIESNYKLIIYENNLLIFYRTGGSLLVTDMARRESIFDIVPNAKQMIREKIEKEGSQLGRVLARCAWNVEYCIYTWFNEFIFLFVFLHLDLFHRMIHIFGQCLQLRLDWI